MKIIPIDRNIANEFIKQHHRHNLPVKRYRFAIGLELNNELIGVGIAGNPVARSLNNGKTLEILRVCVKEGHPNANSKLYSTLVRIARLMGYKSIITYTLPEESESSLKAVGAKKVAYTKPHDWGWKGRPRAQQDIYNKSKIRWELIN